MTDSFCRVFMLIGELAYRRGARSIKDAPGLHEVRIDAHWTARINAHGEEVDGVPPCSMAVDFNGFPAGVFDSRGGVVAAGSAANEETLIEALEKAIEEAKAHENKASVNA